MVKDLPRNRKTIIIADRGYETYNIFANIQEKGLFYLIRVKDVTSNGSIAGSLCLPSKGEFDEDITLKMTRKQKVINILPNRLLLIFWIQNILFTNYPSVLSGFFCRMVTMNA